MKTDSGTICVCFLQKLIRTFPSSTELKNDAVT